jgi:hypothetical protein
VNERPPENPYLTATYAPRPTAPFNGIGVLADTQASINHAQNAIEAYSYNLDAERDRQQARVIKDVNHPYAIQQTKRLGEAGVRGAQGQVMRAGNYALNQGLAIDQFDPLAGDLGVTRQGDRILYGGIDAPTTANPAMKQSQAEEFSRRAFDTPFQVGGDVEAQGQLSPLGATTADGVPLDEPGWTDVPVNPYNVPAPSIPGTPSSMVGITRTPRAREGVSQATVDAAAANLRKGADQLRGMDAQLASLKQALVAEPNSISIPLQISALETKRDIFEKTLRANTANFKNAIVPASGASRVPGAAAGGTYNIPATGADPIPNAPTNATSYQAPPTMPPALVPAFNNVANLYTQHAPGGPGGTETGLLFAGLESSFAPGAKASTSSAAGLTQFVDDTWLRTAKKLPWAKGMPDDQLLALKKSPAHQAQVERQLRLGNYAAAVAKFPGQFDPANPLNLYAMHHFGEDTGGKIAAALRKSPNAPLPTVMGKAWADAVAANPYLVRNGLPLTPAQLYTTWINRARRLGFYGGVRA